MKEIDINFRFDLKEYVNLYKNKKIILEELYKKDKELFYNKYNIMRKNISEKYKYLLSISNKKSFVFNNYYMYFDTVKEINMRKNSIEYFIENICYYEHIEIKIDNNINSILNNLNGEKK